MPISHSDRISGTIYAIATSADSARDMAMARLQADKDAEDSYVYGVFDHQKDADKELHNRYGSYDTDRDRVYAISLDIRIADEK